MNTHGKGRPAGDGTAPKNPNKQGDSNSVTKFSIVPVWVLLAEEITPRAKVLYGILREHVDSNKGDNGPGWLPGYGCASHTRLAELVGVRSRQAVMKLVRELEDFGAVATDSGQAAGRTTKYRVRHDPPPGFSGYTALPPSRAKELIA